jgi:hypothetical protein
VKAQATISSTDSAGMGEVSAREWMQLGDGVATIEVDGLLAYSISGERRPRRGYSAYSPDPCK